MLSVVVATPILSVCLWLWWDSTGFLQCFDTVGLVTWPVSIVPEVTYYVSSGTLSLYTTTATMQLNLLVT